MSKLTDAKEILKEVGMPKKQQTDIAGYTLLTLAGIKPDTSWDEATNEWIRIHDVLEFVREYYNKEYAENTRETIRKNCMHQFREGALIEDNGKSTNSPNYRYRITNEFLDVIRNYTMYSWNDALLSFVHRYDTLIEKYHNKKQIEKMPVLINSHEYKFSPGKHNRLQKAILEEFAPRFAPGCECLYVGDTTEKDLVKKKNKLRKLGFEITLHDKMPDVVLYRSDKDWIYFVEAVTSVGPMSPQRIIELQQMTKNVSSGKIFVTAFPNKRTYKQFILDLEWETEVWIASDPDHMIHLNGDKFMGPYHIR